MHYVLAELIFCLFVLFVSVFVCLLETVKFGEKSSEYFLKVWLRKSYIHLVNCYHIYYYRIFLLFCFCIVFCFVFVCFFFFQCFNYYFNKRAIAEISKTMGICFNGSQLAKLKKKIFRSCYCH